MNNDELKHAEEKIERATRNAFYEVGTELKHIRDNRLYKEQYKTFEQYCLERWGWSDRRAQQLMQSSIIIDNMMKNPKNFSGFIPSHESHVTALSKLEKPEEQIEVWQRVIELLNENKIERITASIVEEQVNRKLAELEKNWITIDEWDELEEKEQKNILNKHYSNNKTFNSPPESIEWAAWSWNPITGCLHNCGYCYAKDIAKRFCPQEFIPSIYPERFIMPKNTKISNPRWKGDIGYKAVFVCSMGDLFGEWVPKEWIDKVIKTIKMYNEWTYIILTKNPKRLVDIKWPDNTWVGVTVDNQKRVRKAEKYLKEVEAKVKFISCEPLTEEIIFNDLSMINWIIIGGYSDRTQPEWKWVENILFKAREHNCKIYFKTNLETRPKEYPDNKE